MKDTIAPQQTSNNKCFGCGQISHNQNTTKDTTAPQQTSNSRGFGCGKTGHTKNECMKKKEGIFIGSDVVHEEEGSIIEEDT